MTDLASDHLAITIIWRVCGNGLVAGIKPDMEAKPVHMNKDGNVKLELLRNRRNPAKSNLDRGGLWEAPSRRGRGGRIGQSAREVNLS